MSFPSAVTASRVWDNIYVGNVADCQLWMTPWRLNTMLPHQVCPTPVCYPMNALDPELDPNGFGVRFPRANLEAIADKIREYVGKAHGAAILIHCAAGIERSPLSVAWYVSKYCGLDFDTAYDAVLKSRPIAQNRKGWIV
jgi:hypothetical protein